MQDFDRARRQARLEQVLARLRGDSTELLNYEDVRRKLKGSLMTSRGLQDIPIDAIVGSVGRYTDFTRSFLPRQDQDENRWVRVGMAMTDLTGVPPIEVYQIGEVYFVMDGNHRVSVAKQLGATHIEAYVTECHTKVPLTPDVRPEDLIVKAEYADFLEATGLDEVRPDADLSMTIPGRYRDLKEHISVHRYFMGVEADREIPYQEAMAHWYDEVYLPVVDIIRKNGILKDFPDRTETDLYLWILRHRDELDRELAWAIRPEVAAEDLVDRFSPQFARAFRRIINWLRRLIVPKKVAPGPPAGGWRRERGIHSPPHSLFNGILVAITGQDSGWHALEHALRVARREEGRVVGLHVVDPHDLHALQTAREVQAEFDRRCQEAGIDGQWILETGGDIATQICDRGRWLDLVVANVAHPPGDQPIARLSSGFRTIIQRCSTPILAIPPQPSDMRSALLAYDGSPKANEALFVCTYLAGRWDMPLTVVTVLELDHTTDQTIDQARTYLEEHGIEATFVEAQGPVGETVVDVARRHGCDLIVMGSYANTVLEIVMGSTVDYVLHRREFPALICR